jgi:hypothetical protein
MKARCHADADLADQVEALFARCPGLAGFSVQVKVSAEGNPEGEEELFVTAIGIEQGAGHDQFAEIFEQIAGTLKEFLDERPEGRILVCGRTFARTLH